MKDPAGGVCEEAEAEEEEGGERKNGVSAAAAVRVRVSSARRPETGRYHEAETLDPGLPARQKPPSWRRTTPVLIPALGERCRNGSSENGGLCRKEEYNCVSGTAHGSRTGGRFLQMGLLRLCSVRLFRASPFAGL
ncbi:uncharacterized protein LOC118627247 isoform X1 [Molossus molossus]|uniref:uncharacterized protein LOC118627247 isoform X1 n=1 Tax=Molossus molossus TaxID=27622 RepID=UPI001745DEFD|nr:uncharacterized protein LOC118627247 isoform X1 [Molossus molossus]XP_036113416.1 uncharacterized protein LOC118627247 isoform X1 [Molossus molossus]